MTKKILIATGGTGGHVFPAYSLAKHFIDKDYDVRITSDARGLRYLKNFPNLKIIKLNSTSIYKTNIFIKLISLFVIFFSILKSIFFLVSNRPNLVFGMGGYSSFPVCISSWILRIPFIIYENNLHTGKTNKFLLPFTKKIFVSYKNLEGVPDKYKSKICEIGNIIRKEILHIKKDQNNLKKNEILNILILGGSQAAEIFAIKLPEIFKKCIDENLKIKIYQQCLPNQNKILNSFYQKFNLDYEIFNFSNDISQYFSKTDLALTRAGSSMLAELINVNIPFISVPLPSSAENHQLKNATYYKEKGYGLLIEEKDLNNDLFDLIKNIYNKRSFLTEIINKQRQYSDKSVYKNIEKHINQLNNEKY